MVEDLEEELRVALDVRDLVLHLAEPEGGRERETGGVMYVSGHIETSKRELGTGEKKEPKREKKKKEKKIQYGRKEETGRV